MLKKIISEVAKEMNESEFLIEDAFDDLFIQIKELMRDPNMPKILIHNFGTFRVELQKLEKTLLFKEILHKENKISDERLKEFKDRIKQVHERLKEEEQAREDRKKKRVQGRVHNSRKQVKKDKNQTTGADG